MTRPRTSAGCSRSPCRPRSCGPSSCSATGWPATCSPRPPAPRPAHDGTNRLQTLYYTTRLARMAGLHRHHTPAAAPTRGHGPDTAVPPPTPSEEPPPRGDVPEPGEHVGDRSPTEADVPVTPDPPAREPDDAGEPIASSGAPLALQMTPTPRRSPHELANRTSRRARPSEGAAGWVGADVCDSIPSAAVTRRPHCSRSSPRFIACCAATARSGFSLQREQLPSPPSCAPKAGWQHPSPDVEHTAAD